eukprot:m.37887 g.37887  ORF g.37887 m.37887 type:complete len:90 (+) comp9364_c0_seq1:1518-1787(+)
MDRVDVPKSSLIANSPRVLWRRPVKPRTLAQAKEYVLLQGAVGALVWDLHLALRKQLFNPFHAKRHPYHWWHTTNFKHSITTVNNLTLD